MTVQQGAAEGYEVTVVIEDYTTTLRSARGATTADERPLIPSEVEPRIGPIPDVPDALRVLWGGGVCDTAYTVRISRNDRSGLDFDVEQGALSNPSCDTLGLRRGVILRFSGPVDADSATGSFQSAIP